MHVLCLPYLGKRKLHFQTAYEMRQPFQLCVVLNLEMKAERPTHSHTDILTQVYDSISKSSEVLHPCGQRRSVY